MDKQGNKNSKRKKVGKLARCLACKQTSKQSNKEQIKKKQ